MSSLIRLTLATLRWAALLIRLGGSPQPTLGPPTPVTVSLVQSTSPTITLPRRLFITSCGTAAFVESGSSSSPSGRSASCGASASGSGGDD